MNNEEVSKLPTSTNYDTVDLLHIDTTQFFLCALYWPAYRKSCVLGMQDQLHSFWVLSCSRNRRAVWISSISSGIIQVVYAGGVERERYN